jgi:hypothetical protein
MGGIVAQDLTNLSDGCIDAVIAVEKNTFAPDPLDNLIPGHKLAAVLDEQAEQLGGNAFKFENLAGLLEFE